MKRILTALLMCSLAGSLVASDLPWLTSLPEAQAKAAKEKKLLFLDFTGSNWCVPCKLLDANVFAKSEFAEYAKKNLVLVQLDYPEGIPQPKELREANDVLAKKYKITGYPTLITMKPDGTIVWRQEGLLKGGLTAWITKLDEAKAK